MVDYFRPDHIIFLSLFEEGYSVYIENIDHAKFNGMINVLIKKFREIAYDRLEMQLIKELS